jgi:hypothetical protein
MVGPTQQDTIDPCLGGVVVRTIPPPPRRSRELVGIVHGPDCHSERLDPLLRGRTDQFGGDRTVRPLWGWIITICKHLWVAVRVGVSWFLNGGWPNHHSTPKWNTFVEMPSLYWTMENPVFQRTNYLFADLYLPRIVHTQLTLQNQIFFRLSIKGRVTRVSRVLFCHDRYN